MRKKLSVAMLEVRWTRKLNPNECRGGESIETDIFSAPEAQTIPRIPFPFPEPVSDGNPESVDPFSSVEVRILKPSESPELEFLLRSVGNSLLKT